MLLVVAVVSPACSRERDGRREEPAPMADASIGGGRSLPDAARCATLKASYVEARLGSDRCERDDECSLEPRGGVYAGLDGCVRSSRRGFDGAAAARLAAQWLGAGCAESFALCPTLGAGALCRGGVCRERPPPPIPEDWVRVDVQESLSLFVPPDLVEVSLQRWCGTGPALRMFHGTDLDLRVEVGHEVGSLPLSDAGVSEPGAPRRVARATRQLASHQATALEYEAPDLSSQEKAPDGSWPRYQFVRALVVNDVDVPLSGGLSIGRGPESVAVAVILEGPGARGPVATRILDTLSFWRRAPP
jgi:hypothetical protein